MTETAKLTDVKTTRLDRIRYMLEKDDTRKCALSTETIPHPNGKPDKVYSKSIWDINEVISNQNLDPCLISKEQLFQYADVVLFNKELPATMAQAKTEVVDEAEPAADKTSADAGSITTDVRISIYTLLLSATELTRLDRRSGADKLKKALEDVTDLCKEMLVNK